MFGFSTFSCRLCGSRKGHVAKVTDDECIYAVSYHYHQQCLHEITCDPEHFKHSQVDTAIVILDLLKKDKIKAAKRRKEFKEQCKILSEHCVAPEK